jgi:hypothetical protein
VSLRLGQPSHERGLHGHDLGQELVHNLPAVLGEGDEDLAAVIRVG